MPMLSRRLFSSFASILASGGAAMALAMLAAAATAEDTMSAAEFDAYVTGKTLTYSQHGFIYGREEYLDGRRVRWQFTDDDCEYGTWYPKDGLICFLYDTGPAEHCWRFWQDDGGLRALSVHEPPGAELSEVRQTREGLNCPAPRVGV